MSDVAERAILHVDMDAFFASVEQRDRPDLRGRPVAVGGDGRRGVVAAASYEARRFGVHSAMPSAVAKRRCPELIFVRGRHAHYAAVSREIFAILESFTPLVQPLSIDEAFMDVTGSIRLFGPPIEIARAIRAQVREATQLTASVGVAPNKFLAKLASDLEKPDGLTVIDADELPGRLALLPIERMWGVGPAMAARLHGLGIRTFGDLQQWSPEQATALIGSSGAHLHRLSLGLDARPVHRDREAKSIGHEQTFGENLEHPDLVRQVLMGQVEQVAWRLRRAGCFARTVTVKIRFDDFRTITRAHTLDVATDTTDVLMREALDLFGTWAARSFRPVRLIGVSLSSIGASAEGQLSLFAEENDERQRRVDAVTDAITGRFGKGAITRTAALRPERVRGVPDVPRHRPDRAE